MAPPQPSKHGRCTRQLVFFLLTTLRLLSSSTTALAAVNVVPTTSYSSHCAYPSPAAPDPNADVSDDAELLSSFHLHPSTGFFSGRGADSLFSPNSCDGALHGRSLSFVPHGVSRTADPTLLHLTATLTLFGGCRAKTGGEYDGRPQNYRRSNHSTAISFDLDGYYSTNSSELCMVGTGTVTEAAGDVLVMVHFASFGEPQGFGHGKGRISSVRDSTDDLYFEMRGITFFGMGNQQQVSASIWRRMEMDPERIVTVASTTLFCVSTVLWIWRLRGSRNHEEPSFMSMAAMHVIIVSLGCVALHFILSHWVFLLVTFVHMFS